MSKTLCQLEDCDVVQDGDGRVHFRADADIDADGANGQSIDANGKALFAYAPDDRGLDLLRNAGYPAGCYRDILVCSVHDRPMVFPAKEGSGGSNVGYYSKTAYFRRDADPFHPDRYLDSAAIPFIVVENFIRRRAKGIVLGCRARVTNCRTGKSVDAIVGDLGPLYKVGEISIAAARAIGINSDPRIGGEEDHVIDYELWPDEPAVINGEEFELIRYVPA